MWKTENPDSEVGCQLILLYSSIKIVSFNNNDLYPDCFKTNTVLSA